MSVHQVNEKRRALIKSGLAAGAAMSIGIPVTSVQAASARKSEEGISWHKGVCRFCGPGCGLQVGVRDDRIIATKGDPDAPVNRGLNCVKGYFNAKIMYGRDRLTQPLMRRTNGKFDKNGKFEPVSWDEAFDEMARQFKRVYAEKGPSGVALVGSGQYTIPEAYTATKLWKGGFRSNIIDPNARLCMASAVVGFYQTFGVDEPANNYSDIEFANTMILWGNNMAEAHPVLWSRVANRKLTDPNTKVINLTTYRNMSSDLADETIIFKPNGDLAIANYLIREIISRGAVDEDFVSKHTIFTAGVTDIGYGLRNTDKYAYPAERDILEKQKRIRLSPAEATAMGLKAGTEVEQKNSGGSAGAHWQIEFEEFRKAVEPYTLDFVAPLVKGDDDARKLQGPPRAPRRPRLRPQARPAELLVHGLQPAPARRLGQRARLLDPSSHGQARQAGQRRLLAHGPAFRLRLCPRGRHVLPPSSLRHARRQRRAQEEDRKHLESARRHAQPQGRLLRHGDHARP